MEGAAAFLATSAPADVGRSRMAMSAPFWCKSSAEALAILTRPRR